jgi:hypothetical protein
MKESQVPKKSHDLTDRKFARLLVLRRAGSDKHGNALWLCRCDCGQEATTTTSHLRIGRVKSCGCLRKETAAATAKTRAPRDKTDWSDREDKYCPDCRQTLPVSEFGKNSSAYDGLTSYCKVHHEERGRLNRAKNHGSGKAYRLKYRHGISIEQYDQMLEAQDHKCAICQQYPRGNLKNPWHVDHDHSSGKVRGILCHSCNTGLGNFNDNPEILKRALGYLQG